MKRIMKKGTRKAAITVPAARGKLPSHLQQIISVDYYGISNVDETDGMNADLLFQGGASNEAKNAISDDDDDQTSATTNFSTDDIIYWRQTGLGAYDGNDSFMAELRGAPANGDNCATDVDMTHIEIRYI